MRLLISLMLLASSISFAKPTKPVPKPADESAALFNLIQQKDTTAQTVTQFLSKHLATNSYVHDSLRGKETLLELSLRLRKQDVFSVLYDYFKKPDVNASLASKGASIYTAVLRYGDWNLIQNMKAAGGDVTKWADGVAGRTELFYAAMSNSVAVVSQFLNEGVNVADKDGFTPLMPAASDNDDAVVTLLLNAGADVKAKTNYDSTALLEAGCAQGVIPHLIAAGADIMAVGIDRYTALHIAAGCNDVEDVRKLLAAGLKVTAKNKYGGIPLTTATSTSAVDAMKVLIEANSDIEARDNNDMTPLYSAYSFAAAKLLIIAGANVNAVTSEYHQSVLKSLMGAVSADEVKLLIAAGADVNSTDTNGGTVLMDAGVFASKEVIQVLLAAGARKSAIDKLGQTAYSQAKDFGRSKDILDLLK